MQQCLSVWSILCERELSVTHYDYDDYACSYHYDYACSYHDYTCSYHYDYTCSYYDDYHACTHYDSCPHYYRYYHYNSPYDEQPLLRRCFSECGTGGDAAYTSTEEYRTYYRDGNL
jgi:hypothetical protein